MVKSPPWGSTSQWSPRCARGGDVRRYIWTTQYFWDTKKAVKTLMFFGLTCSIHQNVSEFHGESDGKVLHAFGRSENAKIIHVIIHVIVARLYQRLVYSEVRCVTKYSFSQDTFSQFWRCSHEMRELRLNVLVGIYPRINCSGFFRVLQRFSRYGWFSTKVPWKRCKTIGLILGCDSLRSSGIDYEKLESWFLGL